MAVVHGKRGTVTIGALVGKARNWTLNTTIDAADVSHFGSEWREFIPGMGSWTATVEALFDPVDDAGQEAARDWVFQSQVGGSGYIQVSLVTGDPQYGNAGSITYSGSGVITAYNHTTDIGDAQVITLDIQGSGELVLS